MLFAGRDRRTVFLLGAGATRGALKHVLLNKKRVKPPLNSDFFQVAATYGRAHGKRSATARRVQRLLKAFKTDIPIRGTPTMEEAFSLLYVAKDFPDIYGAARGRRLTAGYRRDVEDFLVLTSDLLRDVDRLSPITAYDQLVRQLGSGDQIITLNYDTLLDSALVRAGWDPKRGYGLGITSSKIQWRPVGVEGADRLRNVKLLKLHGSVNWHVKGAYSTLRRVFETKPTRVTQPRSNDIGGCIRQIIPPVYGKVFQHKHWQLLWKQAYRELAAAEVLVVIGSSLIDTDFHLRALLSRMASKRKIEQSPLYALVLVDKARVRRKWRRVFRGRFKKEMTFRTFQAFVQDRR